MKTPIDIVRGKITDYDPRTQEVTIKAYYPDWYILAKRGYRECNVQMIDSRPLSDKQRRTCYKLIREIANFTGMGLDPAKEYLKLKFILSWDIPCSFPLLDFVDDVSGYIYACLVSKKCCICGLPAELHHEDAVGAGRDREEIVHEGMEALPLCRTHHTERHTIGKVSFADKYHISKGVILDKDLCRIYRLKHKEEQKSAE